MRRRRKRGALAHGIGRTSGGRNTKLHAICDEHGRPLALLLTAGNVHDCKPAASLIETLPPSADLVADKAYDSLPLRQWLTARGTTPVIPPRKNSRKPWPCNQAAYRQRNLVERLFCRLKDWRRIATRFDRKLHTFFSAVALAATVTCWLN